MDGTIKNPDTLRKQENELDWLVNILKSVQKRGWYGTVAINFKRGMIDLLEKNETVKPPINEKS
jgi:hypothetical protein